MGNIPVYTQKYQAAAKALGLTYGQMNPVSGKVWDGSQFNSPASFNDRRYRNLLVGAKHRSQKFDREFALTLDWLKAVWPTDGKCPILGIELAWGGGATGRDNSPSIDRLENTRGYTPDNCRVISWRANRLKSDATDEETLLLAEDVRRRKLH